MPSEKYPLFCGLHLSALTRRGLVTVSRTRFVNCWFSSDKPRTALIWYILRHEVFKNNPLCQWNFFEKNFVVRYCPLSNWLRHWNTPKYRKDFDFTAISHGYTHFSQHFPTIFFGLNKIIVSVFADFSNYTDISHSQTQKSRPSAPSAVSRDIVFRYIGRYLSTYLCLYVYMYICMYRPAFIKKS